MRRVRRIAVGLVAAVVALAALYWLLLIFPPAFPASVTSGNLSLHSDRLFDVQAGQNVLAGVQARLSRSPLYSAADRHAAYICNAAWRRKLYFAIPGRVGGVNYYPATTNVFLSGARVEEDRLVAPSGRVVEATRPLDYFIAHEITHTLSIRAVGFLPFRRLANWAKEGYAEYVARGPMDYERSARAYLANGREMNFPKSVPYLRYRFLVAHLIEKRHWSPRQVLGSTLGRDQVEALVERDLSGRSVVASGE